MATSSQSNSGLTWIMRRVSRSHASSSGVTVIVSDSDILYSPILFPGHQLPMRRGPKSASRSDSSSMRMPGPTKSKCVLRIFGMINVFVRTTPEIVPSSLVTKS